MKKTCGSEDIRSLVKTTNKESSLTVN